MDNKVTLSPVATNEHQKKGVDHSNNLFRNNWNTFRCSNGYILLHELQNAARNSRIDGEPKS